MSGEAGCEGALDPSGERLAGRSKPWFEFVQSKMHIIDQLGRTGVLHSVSTLLDIGCGNGFLAAYLHGAYATNVVGYEVKSSYQCCQILASPLHIQLFDGRTIPEGPRSFDAVSFISVLHHAANNTLALLKQAAQIGRNYIIVIEDTETGEYDVAFRNYRHDPRGVFRSDAEWKALMAECCQDFVLVREGVSKQRVTHGDAMTDRLVVGLQESDEPLGLRFQRFYVLQRHK